MSHLGNRKETIPEAHQPFSFNMGNICSDRLCKQRKSQTKISSSQPIEKPKKEQNLMKTKIFDHSISIGEESPNRHIQQK